MLELKPVRAGMLSMLQPSSMGRLACEISATISRE